MSSQNTTDEIGAAWSRFELPDSSEDEDDCLTQPIFSKKKIDTDAAPVPKNEEEKKQEERQLTEEEIDRAGTCRYFGRGRRPMSFTLKDASHSFCLRTIVQR